MRFNLDREQCTGCGNCIPACPEHLLQLSLDSNSRYVQYVKIMDEAACLHCGNCELMCTAGAIHVENNRISGYELLDRDAVPPHSGCFLGSIAKALADVVEKLGIRERVVIYKQKGADINLKVESYDYKTSQHIDDALARKREETDKIVILILTSAKKEGSEYNRDRLLAFRDEKITVLNTLNWFETEDFETVQGGSPVLQETAELGYASFVARCGLRSPKEMRQFESCLERALRNQMDGKSFAVIETVFPCFYRLAKRPQTLMPYQQLDAINRWFDKRVLPEYQEGILKE